jgi:hypothetical protein
LYAGFEAYTTLTNPSGTSLSSSTAVEYSPDVVFSCSYCTYQMVGDHIIVSQAGDQIAIMQWGVQLLSYRATLGGSGWPGMSFFAKNNGSVILLGCINIPVICPNQTSAPPITLGNGGPWLSDSVTLAAPPPGDQCNGAGVLNPSDDCSGASPIVINMERGGYQLTGADNPVTFDIHATGSPIRMGWTTAGANEAFLCLDRNSNGVINNGAELFGNATILRNGSRARNGFDALSEFDENHDGVIDANDPVWSSLLLWSDLNHDGISQRAELMPIGETDVTAIGLDYHWTGRRDASGNRFRYESKVWMRRARGRPTPHPVYDIFFVSAR